MKARTWQGCICLPAGNCEGSQLCVLLTLYLYHLSNFKTYLLYELTIQYCIYICSIDPYFVSWISYPYLAVIYCLFCIYKNYISMIGKIFEYFFLKGLWDLAPLMVYLSYTDAICSPIVCFRLRSFKICYLQLIFYFDIFKLIWVLKDIHIWQLEFRILANFIVFLLFNSCFA